MGGLRGETYRMQSSFRSASGFYEWHSKKGKGKMKLWLSSRLGREKRRDGDDRCLSSQASA